MKIFKGRVIDGNGGKPIENGAAVVEGNTIIKVCDQNELPPYQDSFSLGVVALLTLFVAQYFNNSSFNVTTAEQWKEVTLGLSRKRLLHNAGRE